jgi:hypothetical protein
MDTIRPQLVDDQRAQEIFARVRSRLSNERLKTNEKYLEILIDEINKYFADMSTCTIDSNDLPNDRSGPSATKHNKLLVNIATDIDKVHGKRIEVQDVITKAVNYLSTERVSINNAVSRAHARVINHKLRSSMNDRHVTVFTEYFTTEAFVDKTLSKNVSVDSSLSALTLTPISINMDNSNFIDPSTIYLEAKVSSSADINKAGVYPICNQPFDLYRGTRLDTSKGMYYAGFGRTLTSQSAKSSVKNLVNATWDDSEKAIDLQKQSLVFGDVSTNTDSTLEEQTWGEFEIVFNDFKSGKMRTSIIKAIKNSSITTAHMALEDEHVRFDQDGVDAQSFRGAYINKNGNTVTDLISQKAVLDSLGLRFKLKEGNLKGLISYLKIYFAPAETNICIPKINYAGCYIKDVDGKTYVPFKEMTINSTTDEAIESRFLMLSQAVANPKEFYIDFDLESFRAVPMGRYVGCCWKVELKGSDMLTTYKYSEDLPEISLTTDSKRYIVVYHDPVRSSSDTSLKTLNFNVLNAIIKKYNTSVLTSQSPRDMMPG